jgi:hypothetical protein
MQSFQWVTIADRPLMRLAANAEPCRTYHRLAFRTAPGCGRLGVHEEEGES